MLPPISAHLHDLIQNFSEKDTFLLDDTTVAFDQQRYQRIFDLPETRTIAFVDGGQAEIVRAGNFTVSFIRIHAQIFADLKKKDFQHHEFFVVTTANWHHDKIWYKSVIFTEKEKLFPEEQLFVDSADPLLRRGAERAGTDLIMSMARRFAELAVAKKINADFVVLDGTLEATFPGEEKVLAELPSTVCAIAKSSSLLTQKGNSPAVLLQKYGLTQPWFYPLNERTAFVKLHANAKHVFRFAGNREVLPYLLPHAADALFLGYPYGLVFADKMARVSNQEQKALSARILLSSENKDILEYLTTQDANAILDSLG